ncbi:ATP phosphoribosyltransferase regulatory subunit [Anaerosacchariphilus polymeriproducens]|uniref:ATP phosphoribosyltransferase regulatory subunit n=1 Tax=Anaerosacchariphilus polymeriproducens TaxID=1812858 RepID=A0A371AU00_9FIRM|nr:ATP phosphoribosyltransferase regulatory subunit [Anaerosacchariphilus polymeriproducens]RDU23029.1 ATP phosphoribosyltransferase regulatory subunit [Anaerosacchariphilus polymeriproducens]
MKLLHTPEGVRDIYNGECEKKNKLQENLHNTLKKYGYHPIQTPTFEFFDVFNHEVGTIPSKDLFKFFDREGNTLVLRPDITPSIARAASKYFMDEKIPIRLSYMGNTFINNSSYQGRLKESTQLGAELIGDSSVDADTEIIVLVIELLLTAGLKDFQVSIGQVDFFKSLIKEANFDEETEENLREYITNKNIFGVEEILSIPEFSSELKEIFLKMTHLFGSIEVVSEAKRLTTNEGAINALQRLEKIYEVLSFYGFEQYVSFDLSMLNSYQYYTGVIFRAFTFGTGDAVVKGGRYDQLMARFGKNSPSIGFAVVIDQLMNALARQKIDIPIEKNTTLIVYTENMRQNAIHLAMNLRKKSCNVELILMDYNNETDIYEDYALKNHIQEILIINNNKVKKINIEEKHIQELTMEDLLY